MACGIAELLLCCHPPRPTPPIACVWPSTTATFPPPPRLRHTRPGDAGTRLASSPSPCPPLSLPFPDGTRLFHTVATMVAFSGLAPALPARPPRGEPAARRRPSLSPPAVGGRVWPRFTATGPHAAARGVPVGAAPPGATPGVPPPASVPVVVPAVASPWPRPVTPVPAAATERAGMPVAADKRVVVVGAGWAGLGAAHALAKAGHDVTLVDAADSVGGLVAGWRTAKGNKPVEVGVRAGGSGRAQQGGRDQCVGVVFSCDRWGSRAKSKGVWALVCAWWQEGDGAAAAAEARPSGSAQLTSPPLSPVSVCSPRCLPIDPRLLAPVREHLLAGP